MRRLARRDCEHKPLVGGVGHRLRQRSHGARQRRRRRVARQPRGERARVGEDRTRARRGERRRPQILRPQPHVVVGAAGRRVEHARVRRRHLADPARVVEDELAVGLRHRPARRVDVAALAQQRAPVEAVRTLLLVIAADVLPHALRLRLARHVGGDEPAPLRKVRAELRVHVGVVGAHDDAVHLLVQDAQDRRDERGLIALDIHVHHVHVVDGREPAEQPLPRRLRAVERRRVRQAVERHHAAQAVAALGVRLCKVQRDLVTSFARKRGGARAPRAPARADLGEGVRRGAAARLVAEHRLQHRRERGVLVVHQRQQRRLHAQPGAQRELVEAARAPAVGRLEEDVVLAPELAPVAPRLEEDVAVEARRHAQPVELDERLALGRRARRVRQQHRRVVAVVLAVEEVERERWCRCWWWVTQRRRRRGRRNSRGLHWNGCCRPVRVACSAAVAVAASSGQRTHRKQHAAEHDAASEEEAALGDLEEAHRGASVPSHHCVHRAQATGASRRRELVVASARAISSPPTPPLRVATRRRRHTPPHTPPHTPRTRCCAAPSSASTTCAAAWRRR